jgi:hypothetical protein
MQTGYPVHPFARRVRHCRDAEFCYLEEVAMNLSRLAGGSMDDRSDSGTSHGSTLHAWQTPLTGRDTELSLLEDRWEQAQEGMGQVVLVCRPKP